MKLKNARMSDFEVFIKKNNLKKSAIAQYIGVSNGFIKIYELIGIEMPDSIQNANTITKVKTIFHQG